DGGPRTGRAGPPGRQVRRTRTPSPPPPTASGGAPRPARPGRGSPPSPSRAAAGAPPPIPVACQSGAASSWGPLFMCPRVLTDRATPVEVVFERAERAVPVAGQRSQKLLCHLHRRRPQPVPHPAPLPRLGRYQAGLGQQAQMLGDRLPRDRQALG